MKPHSFKIGLVWPLLFLFFSVTLAHAANQKPAIKPASIADIKQRIQFVKDKQNLGEDLKNRILSAYYESEDNLNETEAQDAQAESFKQALNSLPLETKRIAKQIEEAEANLKNRRPERWSLFPTDELEQRLIIEKTKLSDLDAEISRVEAQIGELMNRPQLLREKVSELKGKQASSQQEQQLLASRGGDNLYEKEASQIQLETRVKLLNSTLKTLELENISNPLRLQAQKDRMHLLNLQREQLAMLIADLDNHLLDRRQQLIDKERDELLQAEKDAEGKHPLIREATKENMRYNRSLQAVNKNMEQYLIQKNEMDARYKQLEKDYQSAEQKISLAGLSPALGNLLREQRRNIPQHKQFGALNDEIQDQIALTSLESFKLDEAKKNLSDINQTLLNRVAQLPADTDDAEKLRIRAELRLLLNDQKDLVVRLAGANTEYARVLGDVDFSLQQMLGIADKFGAYLDQRLLWVPSAPVIDQQYLKDIVHSVFWFFDPGNWRQVAQGFWDGLVHNPVSVLVGLAIVLLHWRFRKSVKLRLETLLRGNAANASVGETLSALVYLGLLSLYGALLMAWIGGVLALNARADFFSRSFAEGLLSTASALCVVQFSFRLFKPSGVAETLFQWPNQVAQLLYRQIKWLRFLLVPSVFVTAMTGSDLFSEHSYALGRTALIVLMLAFTYVFHCLAHPQTGLAKSFYRLSHGWLSRLRFVWYAIAVLTPLVIVGFAVAGYYQSALELYEKLVYSLRLMFATALLYALILRWFRHTERQLALRNAKQKRKQAEQVQTSSAADEAFAPDKDLLDITKINQQGRKLLTTLVMATMLVGFWAIWSDILPAFSVFDNVVLWQYGQMIDGKDAQQPVTLINLLICLLYGGLAFVFASNFPALVDLLTVGKFAMTAGSRYALIQLVRYTLTAITFLAVANELGGSWSQVQWLVAALSVGLGFGLQEIFANMVSGIILLFERPIRVGDTVTVGDVTGRVSRIQMRATHIVDWDRKELVVPNKTFITDRLINWTLSDTVTRVMVPVSVAYGSDIEIVERILREAIKATELVLQEPEPAVIFVGFGESSLDFKIQVFVSELAERVTVTHQLHVGIYNALQSHHIEIPYPQRDVHIRSIADVILPDRGAS
ncbi:mechanosensitive ion channel protein MscS [Methylomonas sp. LWB]|uniref:mechanosensitive ion channel domain-containing protein n=1 Tax=Methylomonas sp. LWB TaxID=1905845 RepID=UPI0008DA4A3A|nr:mechanosensitive ion channel domain-containing protein [Methylomonas sp. LWB]OHX38080.1 mechanosensitive ion channel protein MscS [Methylomonas sp. LWB]